MARFCENCGVKLEDNDKFCGHCGAPVESVLPVSGPKRPERKKINRKAMARVCGLAMIVVAVILIVCIISQSIGYKGLLRKVMVAYEKYDIDTLVSLSSDIYYYGEEDLVEYTFKQQVSSDLDYFESVVGHNYKLTYEVNEIYVAPDRKVEKMLDGVEDAYFGFDPSIIKKVVIADLTVTATRGSKSTKRNLNIVMTKENGDWKLFYIE